MKPALTPRLWPFVLLVAAAVTLNAAFTTGGTAYTKRVKTKLLAEPKPTAESIGEVGFAQPLTISNVQGSWLKVDGMIATGWIFVGNVSATKPDQSTGTDKLGLGVAETTASAAARPLTPAAKDYANRRGLTNPSNDLDWLLAECAKVTDENVDKYLKTTKRGEYK